MTAGDRHAGGGSRSDSADPRFHGFAQCVSASVHRSSTIVVCWGSWLSTSFMLAPSDAPASNGRSGKTRAPAPRSAEAAPDTAGTGAAACSSALKYIATKVPTRLAMASTFVVFGYAPGTGCHHVQEVADEFVGLRQDFGKGVSALVHRRRDEVVDLLCAWDSTVSADQSVAGGVGGPGTQAGQRALVSGSVGLIVLTRSPRTRSARATRTIRPTSSNRESSLS